MNNTRFIFKNKNSLSFNIFIINNSIIYFSYNLKLYIRNIYFVTFFTFTLYLFIKCYINAKQDKTFSYSLGIKEKVKTYINFYKNLLSVIFREINNIIGYIAVLIITIMLLCTNNALLIYYFDLPIDIV